MDKNHMALVLAAWLAEVAHNCGLGLRVLDWTPNQAHVVLLQVGIILGPQYKGYQPVFSRLCHSNGLHGLSTRSFYLMLWAYSISMAVPESASSVQIYWGESVFCSTSAFWASQWPFSCLKYWLLFETGASAALTSNFPFPYHNKIRSGDNCRCNHQDVYHYWLSIWLLSTYCILMEDINPNFPPQQLSLTICNGMRLKSLEHMFIQLKWAQIEWECFGGSLLNLYCSCKLSGCILSILATHPWNSVHEIIDDSGPRGVQSPSLGLVTS